MALTDRQARRIATLESASGVLEALSAEGMVEATHGVGVGIHTYLLKIAKKLRETKTWPPKNYV